MTYEEWFAKAHPTDFPNHAETFMMREEYRYVWDAAIAAAAEQAECHGFDDDVSEDPLLCQGCAEEVAANIRTLDSTFKAPETK